MSDEGRAAPPTSPAPAGAEAPPGLDALGGVPAPLLGLMAMTSIHLGAALATRLFATVGESGAALLRLAIAAVLLCAWARPRPRALLAAAPVHLLAFGVLLAALNVTFYLAVARLPLGVVATMEFAGPLAVAFATSRRARHVLWVALAALGLALLTPLGPGRLDPLGLLFAALASACLGAYLVVGGRLGRRTPGFGALALAMALAALLAAPLGVADGGAALLRPGVLLLGLAVAVVSTALPFTLEFAAMRRMSARAYGVLLSVEPAIAALVGVAFLGDALGVRQLAALACIVIASAGSTLGDAGR